MVNCYFLSPLFFVLPPAPSEGGGVVVTITCMKVLTPSPLPRRGGTTLISYKSVVLHYKLECTPLLGRGAGGEDIIIGSVLLKNCCVKKEAFQGV